MLNESRQDSRARRQRAAAVKYAEMRRADVPAPVPDDDGPDRRPQEVPRVEEGPGAHADRAARARAAATSRRKRSRPMAEQTSRKPHKNEKVGEVVSTKMAKTIVVEVTPPRAASALQAHRHQAQEVLRARRAEHGARRATSVRIIECRPLSKLKRWTLGEVIRRAVQVGVDAG